jgi:hypothetical protein
VPEIKTVVGKRRLPLILLLHALLPVLDGYSAGTVARAPWREYEDDFTDAGRADLAAVLSAVCRSVRFMDGPSRQTALLSAVSSDSQLPSASSVADLADVLRGSHLPPAVARVLLSSLGQDVSDFRPANVAPPSATPTSPSKPVELPDVSGVSDSAATNDADEYDVISRDDAEDGSTPTYAAPSCIGRGTERG